MAVYDEAIQHRSNDYDENDPDDYGHRGWRSLTLHGLGKHVSQHWDSKDVREAGYVYENEQEARKAYHWTEIADKCPKTVEMIKSIPDISHLIEFVICILNQEVLSHHTKIWNIIS